MNNRPRNTRRWPLCVFYTVLNVGGVNVAVIFSNVMVANWGRGLGKASRRNQFLLTLGQQATFPWIPKSSTIPDPHAGLRSLVRKIEEGNARCEAPRTSERADVLFVPGKMTEKQ
jgi:hypothetical protein